LLYGRGLNTQRISQFQQRSGNAIVIVSSWRIDDYQVVRIAGSLSAKIKKIAEKCVLDVVPLGNIPRLRAPGLLVMDMDSTAIQTNALMKLLVWRELASRLLKLQSAQFKEKLILVKV